MINWNKLYMYSTYSKRSTNAVLLQLVQPAQRTLDWNDLFLPRTRPTLYLRSPTFLPAWQEFLPLTTCWFGLHSPPLHMHSSHVFISKLKHRWVKFKTRYEECFQCGSNSKLKLLRYRDDNADIICDTEVRHKTKTRKNTYTIQKIKTSLG